MIFPVSSYDRIVWDFNGTLLDDVRHGIRCINHLLSERGLRTLDTLEEYYAVFGFPIEEYYRRLGLLEKEPYSVVANEWIALYRADEAHIPARPGAVALLKKLHAAGVPQTLLSATELGMLRGQLDYLGITDCFDEVLGRSDIYAADKIMIARGFAVAHEGEKVLFIGDTDHDKAAADAGKMTCVLVEGGHQSKAYLATLGCDVVPDFETLGGMLFG